MTASPKELDEEEESDEEALTIAKLMDTIEAVNLPPRKPSSESQHRKQRAAAVRRPVGHGTPSSSAGSRSPGSPDSPHAVSSPRRVQIQLPEVVDAAKKSDALEIHARADAGDAEGAPLPATNARTQEPFAAEVDQQPPNIIISPPPWDRQASSEQTLNEQTPAADTKTAAFTTDVSESTVGASSEAMQNKLRFAFLESYAKLSAAEAETTCEEGRALTVTQADQTVTAVKDSEAEHCATRDWEDGVHLGAEAAVKQGYKKTSQSPAAAFRNGEDTPLPPLHDVSRPLPGTKPDSVSNRKEQREAEEIKQLFGSIRPFDEPGVLVGICKRLMELLQTDSNYSNLHLVTQYGAVPIVEMLQVTDPELLRTVLKVVNQIVDGNQSFQENFAMSGLIPAVLKFARPYHSRPLRYEAACFVSRLCHTSALSLQMLVACGGLEALVDLVSHDYYHNRDLVWLSLDALNKIFESASRQSQKSDFCRILAKHGLCIHFCALVDTLACDIHDRAKEYLKVVVDLLFLFAREGDAVVKVYMAKGPVLEGLIASLEFLPPDLTVQICRTFKWLAQEPSVLNMLENAGVVPVLVHFLSLHAGQKSQAEDECVLDLKTQTSSQANDAGSQCMLALYFLCKLSRARQEQAALAGVLPLLQELVGLRKDLRGYAFAMICSMTCASLASRKILWDQGGVAFFVRSLAAPDLQTPALEALVDWLSVKEHHADWCARVEAVLLQGGEFIERIVALFRVPKAQAAVFVKILDPLLKFLRVSRGIKDALASNDEFFQELVNRLKLEQKIGGASLETSCNFNSVDGLHALETISDSVPVVEALEATESRVKAPSSHVRRLASEPAVTAGVDVRVRIDLLRLLLLLCENQGREQLAALCQRYRLQMLMHQVLSEEQRKQRVILCEIAQQLLGLFKDL